MFSKEPPPRSSKEPQNPPAVLVSRLPALTGMRFIAAALVFFSHILVATYIFASPDAARVVHRMFDRAGFAGVGFFFILSGFVLTWSARSGDTAPKFWRRRFFKIYPNHLITIVAGFILVTQSSHQPVNHKHGVLSVLLVQAWFPSLPFAGNMVAWSLSCELLFYFTFPFLLRLLNKISPNRLWLWAIGTVVAICIVPPFVHLLPGGPPPPSVPFTYTQVWFLFMFPPVRMLDFVLGILLARIAITGRRIPLRLWAALPLAIAVYTLIPTVLPRIYYPTAAMAAPLGLVILAGATADRDRRPTLFGTRPMVWLGDISFAFYMTHFLILAYGTQLLTHSRPQHTAQAIGVLALLFAATVVASWLLYTLVERPLMRRFATSRRAKQLRPPARPDELRPAA